jgi:DNA-directed RNA polymerase sigma subunit (sigma70/sigma32)
MVNSVLNAAVEIAIQRHKQLLNNDVIQIADLFQEAVKTAYDGTLLYNYSTKNTWFTFVYGRMYDVLGNFIADRSRVVSVPRSTIERFNLILKAIQHTKSIDPMTLAEHANKLIQNEKALEYSPDEIETILKSMQGNISLDFIIDDDTESGKHSLLDILAVETEVEDTVTQGFLKKNVGNALKKLLTPLEFTVVDLLWGITSGDPKDLHAVYEEVKTIYPDKKISKVRVRRTADKVLARLRKNPELRNIWREL